MARKAPTYDRGETWSHKETMTLIEAWGDPETQRRLKSSIRNMDVFEDIAAAVRLRLGCDRTASQCRSRIKRMKTDYLRARQNIDCMGRHGKKFPFFEEMDQIYKSQQLGSSVPTDSPNCSQGAGPESGGVDWEQEADYLSTGENSAQDHHAEANDDEYSSMFVVKVEQPEDEDTDENNMEPDPGAGGGLPQYGGDTRAGGGLPQYGGDTRAVKRPVSQLHDLSDSITKLESMIAKKARYQDDLDKIQQRNDEKHLQYLSEIIERQKLQQTEMSYFLKQLPTSTENDTAADSSFTKNELSSLLAVTQNMADTVTKVTDSWGKFVEQQEKLEASRAEREEQRFKLLKETLEQQRREEKDMFYKFMDMQMKMFQMFCSSLKPNSSTSVLNIPANPGTPSGSTP